MLEMADVRVHAFIHNAQAHVACLDIAVNQCNGLIVSSPNFVQLGAGTYYTLSDTSQYIGVGLSSIPVAGRPSGPPTARQSRYTFASLLHR